MATIVVGGVGGMIVSHTIDVFWSFRSPYSDRVTPDLLRLRRDFDVRVTLAAFLPIAVRSKGLVSDAADKKRPRYIGTGSRRRAAFLGLRLRWPRPDPVTQDRDTSEVPEDQPRIWRLMALALAA